MRQRTFISDLQESLDVPPARAASVLLVVLLAGLAASGSPSLARPSWTPGDFWAYATNTTLLPGLYLAGSVTSTVQGTAPMPSGGTSGYVVLLSGMGMAAGVVTNASRSVAVQGEWILTGKEIFEPLGLQPVYSLLDLSVNGTAGGIVAYSIRVQNTTTFQVASSDWQYPFAAGSGGNASVVYNFTQDVTFNGPWTYSHHSQGTGTWAERFAAADPVDVATAAGTFQAYPITEAWPDGSHETAFESPQTGNAVRTEGYNATGNRTSVTTLTAYRYQALEPPTFLGLTAMEWAVVVSAVAAAAIGIVVLRRRSRKRRERPPEGSAPPDLTSNPRGP